MTTLSSQDFRGAKTMPDPDAAWTGTTPYLWGYGYQTGFGYTANSTASNTITPISQIRRKLRNDPAIAAAMDDIRLSRRGDQLVISGKVASKDLKDKIGGKVGDVANGWDVANHLSVSTVSE